MSIDVSKILDNVSLIEDSKQPRTCTCTKRKTTVRKMRPDAEKCGKPAVYEVLRTCCDAPNINYRCADHTDVNPTPAVGCVHCLHVCRAGVCLHRILNPI